MEKSVSITMNLRSAAVIRQILFEHQKGYSYEFPPERINDVRNVIQEIDKRIEEQIKE
jgi:hypothetical protein